MHSPFSLLSAGEIRFGRGQIKTVAAWITPQAQRVLLVHGSTLARAQAFYQQLQNAGLHISTFAVATEPCLADIQNGVNFARQAGVELVVSVGGGAVIDAGKAIAALIPAEGDLIDYLEVVGNGKQLTSSPLPFVAIPTTAGTGAEVTKNAVINVPEHQRKVSLRDNRMLPNLAVVDPSLTDNSPRSVTLASGLDALTQVIEPYLCTRANAFTDAICRDAIPRAIRALVALIAEESPQQRDEMAWVSLSGGLALANSGLGVIHGLAGPLGGLCSAAHGALCGTLLPYGLELHDKTVTSPKIRQRLDEIRHWLADSLQVPPAQAFTALRDWSRSSGLGSLQELGVPENSLVQAAEAASNASSMKANPVTLDQSQLLNLLQQAW